MSKDVHVVARDRAIDADRIHELCRRIDRCAHDKKRGIDKVFSEKKVALIDVALEHFGVKELTADLHKIEADIAVLNERRSQIQEELKKYVGWTVKEPSDNSQVGQYITEHVGDIQKIHLECSKLQDEFTEQIWLTSTVEQAVDLYMKYKTAIEQIQVPTQE